MKNRIGLERRIEQLEMAAGDGPPPDAREELLTILDKVAERRQAAGIKTEPGGLTAAQVAAKIEARVAQQRERPAESILER